jgi:hypothetical protein
VLNPPRLRKDLGELALSYRPNGTVFIEQEGSRAGGALIESENVTQ